MTSPDATEVAAEDQAQDRFIDLAMSLVDRPSPWYLRRPILAWLVATVRPRSVVELGTPDVDRFFALCEAVQRLDVEATCLAAGSFTLPSGNGHVGGVSDKALTRLASDCRARFGPWAIPARPEKALSLAGPTIDLLHLRFPGSEAQVQGDQMGLWLDRLRPGSVVVATAAGGASLASEVWDEVAEAFPSFVFADLGVALAQVPDRGAAPIVAVLDRYPIVQAHLAALTELGEYRYALGTEPCTPSVIREAVATVQAERWTEREAFRCGLSALREEIGRALTEKGELEQELSAERERRDQQLALEHQRQLAEQRAEVDKLAAKLAMMAARHEQALIGARDEQAVALTALHAQLEAAREELRGMRSSTSWRVTAVLRWAGRRMRRIRHGRPSLQ